MERFKVRSGHKITYEILSKKTGLSRATVESLGTRLGYNASLETIDKICNALECSLEDLLVYTPEEKQG